MTKQMRVGVKGALITGICAIIAAIIYINGSKKEGVPKTQEIRDQHVDSGNINNYNVGRDVRVETNNYNTTPENGAHSQNRSNLFKLSIPNDSIIKLIESSSRYKYSGNSDVIINVGYSGDIVPVNADKSLFYFNGGNIVIENKKSGCREELHIQLDRTDPTGNNYSAVTKTITKNIVNQINSNLSTISNAIIKCLG